MATYTGKIVSLTNLDLETNTFAMIIEFNMIPLTVYNKDDNSVPSKAYVTFPKVKLNETVPKILYYNVEASAPMFLAYPAVNSTIIFST